MTREHADDLVGLIYDTVAAPERWPSVLERIAALVGGRAAALVLLDARDVRSQFAIGAGAFDDDAMARYGREFSRLDPAPPAFARQPVAAAAATDRMFSREMLARDVFLNEFLRPLGLEECLGAMLLRDEHRTALIGVQRGRDRRSFDDSDLASIDRLLPHLQRALQLHKQFAAMDGVGATLAAVVDDLPSGLIVLDRDGRAAHVNRTAAAIAARRDGIAIDRNGQIALAGADAAAKLGALLRAVLHEGEAGGVVHVPRKHGRAGYTLLVSPQPRRLGVLDTGDDERARGALVVIHDPTHLLQVPAGMLRAAFGMTRREEELVGALVAGIGVAAFAAQAGISLNTVRFHLKAIYAKTGARGQADLVRTVMATLAALGAERHAPLWQAAANGNRRSK